MKKVLIIICSKDLPKEYIHNIKLLKKQFTSPELEVDYCCISSFDDFSNYESIIPIKYKVINQGFQLTKICDFITENKDKLDYDWYVKFRPEMKLFEPINFDDLSIDAINARVFSYKGPKRVKYGTSCKILNNGKYDEDESFCELDDMIYVFHNNVIQLGAFNKFESQYPQTEGFHTFIWGSRGIKFNIIGINTRLNRCSFIENRDSGHLNLEIDKETIPELLYINGFWPGFIEKTDGNHIGFFEQLFSHTRLSNMKRTNNVHEATVLLESMFNSSAINSKNPNDIPWKYKIFYLGEPNNIDISNYDITLHGSAEGKNSVNLPLYVYYIHRTNFLERCINKPIVTKIPPKFCCFIISNSCCPIRNKMFEMLNTYKRVDSLGRYNNNVGYYLHCGYWTDEFRSYISQYKFIICFENTKKDWYHTEKIVNPYLSGVIPIYWSSHTIKEDINTESMIFLEDESEESFKNVINKVIELDQNDEKYLECVNKPMFNDVYDWKSKFLLDIIAREIDKLL